MIVRVKIASSIHHYLMHATQKSMQNRFCFAFSEIKKKADYYICAATAIMTLTNNKSKSLLDESTSQQNQDGSKMATVWLQRNQPFSLREKVVHNVSQLQLYESQNRQKIIELFKLDHGLSLENLQIQQRIQNGAWIKKFEKRIDQKYFVFNPTSVFKQLFDFFNGKWAQRKILMGYYGIGKSSNQLLANILTTHLFQFRKEGERAEKELQEIIMKNLNLLTQIMDFTNQDLEQFKNNKQLVQYIIKQFFNIPFILYYSIPQQKLNQSIKKVGFTQKDFIKYFGKKQIQKFPQKTCQYFCQQIEKICKQNRIPMCLVIDQSNFYFSILRKLLAVKQEIYVLESKISLQQNKKDKADLKIQMRELRQKRKALHDRAQAYGIFLNRVAQVFITYPYITLSCSQNAEYTLYPMSIPPRQNLYTIFSNIFFSKQASIWNIEVQYGRNRNNEDWQRDMDLVFWFQLENALLNQIFAEFKTKLKLQKSGKIEALNYLKYYYYYHVFYGDFKDLPFWQNAARHRHINKILKGIIHQNKQSKERIQIMQIINNLVEKKKKNKTQYHENNDFLIQFTKIIKELRQTVNTSCKKLHKDAEIF